MGVATAIAAVGAAAAVYGSVTSANAANRAARAQQDAANRWGDQVGARNREAEQAYAEYAPSQQAAIEKAIAGQQRNIARQESLLANVDPALFEAGKQMKQLLDGQSAPVLNQLNEQRQLQRNKLLDTLRQQMGPGAETSSMGQNMMMKFDAETANMLNATQQQYLDKVSNIALNGSQGISGAMTQAQSLLGTLGNDLGDIGNLIMGGTAQLAGPMSAQVNAAGGEFKGQQIMGQMYGQLGGALIQGAGAYAGGVAAGEKAQPGALGTPGTLSGDASRLPTSQDYYNAYRSDDPYSQYMSNFGKSGSSTFAGGGAGTYGGSGMSGNGPWANAYVGGGYSQPAQQTNYAAGMLGNNILPTAGGY
jgi:hypothetical protein